MVIFFTVVHVLLCVLLIFFILLQPGKDAGMGSALGGGAATSAFGGRGGVTFLSKATGVIAAFFFVTSLGLSFVGLRSSVAATGLPPAAATAPTGAAGAADAGVAQDAASEALIVEQPAEATPPASGEAGAPVAPTVPGAEPAAEPAAPAPTAPVPPGPSPSPAP